MVKYLLLTVMAVLFAISLTVPIITPTFAKELTPDAKKYLALAKKYKPSGKAKVAVHKYMKLSPAQRKKVLKGGTRGPILFGIGSALAAKYGAYAVCFWAGVAGSDMSAEEITDIGEDCNAKWVD